MATNALTVHPNYQRFRALALEPSTADRFAMAVGKHNAGPYLTSVMVAVANSQQLQECEPLSIITSAVRAASLRLSCDPATKQAHLVPFKGKATLVVGAKGYLDMAARTGKYRVLNDFKVYEGQRVIEDQLTGKVRIGGYKESNEVAGYGFFFEMKNGLSKVLYMTVQEIDAHAKRYSPNYGRPNSLWTTDFPSMARKTVIRLCLSRYGYLDPTDAQILQEIDDVVDAPVIISDDGDDRPTHRPQRSANQILGELGYHEPVQDAVIKATEEIVTTTTEQNAPATSQEGTTATENGNGSNTTSQEEMPLDGGGKAEEGKNLFWSYIYDTRHWTNKRGLEILEQAGGAWGEALLLAKKQK